MAEVGGWSNVHMPSSAAGRTVRKAATRPTIAARLMKDISPICSTNRKVSKGSDDNHPGSVSVPAWLLDLLARYGYAAVFVGVLLENTGVPVPGETILLAGAALAQFGRLSLGWVIATAIAGAHPGDDVEVFI